MGSVSCEIIRGSSGSNPAPLRGPGQLPIHRVARLLFLKPSASSVLARCWDGITREKWLLAQSIYNLAATRIRNRQLACIQPTGTDHVPGTCEARFWPWAVREETAKSLPPRRPRSGKGRQGIIHKIKNNVIHFFFKVHS